MYQRNCNQFLTRSLCSILAFGAFAVVSGQAAHAQATRVTSQAQLAGGTMTGPYPGANFSTFAGPFVLTAGSTTVTFSDAGGQFSRFNADGSVDFPNGTPLIQTADATNIPQGPLNLSFNTGVTGFGLGVQNYQFDQETFTVQAFNGATVLGTFTYGPANNDPLSPGGPAAGKSIFVGALANNGPLITRATISSISTVPGGNNNFFAGPLFLGSLGGVSPAPESPTIVSFGMGMCFVAGLVMIKRKRGANQAALASQSSAD